MPVRDEIAELLRLPESGDGAPSLAAIESTLTDGYAAALALEAEKLRLEQRLGQVARDAGAGQARELALLAARLDAADGEIARLRVLLRSLQARARARRSAAAAAGPPRR
ncbi:MAG TPA: hypothetical protein VE995_06235 [Gaiellaceae bacterium]|nr:hypothetical protein [Gaiellaceae bacterium]